MRKWALYGAMTQLAETTKQYLTSHTYDAANLNRISQGEPTNQDISEQMMNLMTASET